VFPPDLQNLIRKESISWKHLTAFSKKVNC
jgi:hypothetical protein